jgi:cytochrome c oxidase subunit 2
VTAKGVGEHDIVCAFLCGIGHAAMNSEVGQIGEDGKPQSLIKRIQVMTQTDFDAWVADQQAKAQEAASQPGAEGVAVFNANGCQGCHALAAANAAGNVGPGLETSTLQSAADAAGEPLDAFVKESIVNPSAHIAEGYSDIMPKDFGDKIQPEQLDQLVALLAGAPQ